MESIFALCSDWFPSYFISHGHLVPTTESYSTQFFSNKHTGLLGEVNLVPDLKSLNDQRDLLHSKWFVLFFFFLFTDTPYSKTPILWLSTSLLWPAASILPTALWTSYLHFTLLARGRNDRATAKRYFIGKLYVVRCSLWLCYCCGSFNRKSLASQR